MGNRYLVFAEWRIATHRRRDGRQSVRFFRKTRNHTLIWTVVMRGFYSGRPPSVNDCIAEATCSKETSRKILLAAEAAGYFELRPAADDSRKKLVYPSTLCAREYEAMVDGYLALGRALAPDEAAGQDGPKI